MDLLQIEALAGLLFNGFAAHDQAQAALAPIAEIALGGAGAPSLQAVRDALTARARKAGLAV